MAAHSCDNSRRWLGTLLAGCVLLAGSGCLLPATRNETSHHVFRREAERFFSHGELNSSVARREVIVLTSYSAATASTPTTEATSIEQPVESTDCSCAEPGPIDGWPCEPRSLCFDCDRDNCLPTLWQDARGVVNWNNSLILLAAGGAAIAMREGDADRDVREAIARNPRRWGSATQTLGTLGNIEVQAPVLLSLYGLSLWTDDEEMHHVAGSLLSAATITGLSTSALKLATNTDRPTGSWNGGQYGFPSYHTASSFAIAAVLDEYYGAKAGLPAYALATAIGFSRLDEQDHDLSDVVFGGTLGFVIGKAVAGRHLCGNSKIQFAPYFHPTDGTPGVCCEAKF